MAEVHDPRRPAPQFADKLHRPQFLPDGGSDLRGVERRLPLGTAGCGGLAARRGRQAAVVSDSAVPAEDFPGSKHGGGLSPGRLPLGKVFVNYESDP